MSLRDTSGVGDPVPKRLRNPRRAYDSDGRMILPMTLANLAKNGGRSVRAICPCGHKAEVAIDRFPLDMAVRDVGLSLRCSACDAKGPETEPAFPKSPWSG